MSRLLRLRPTRAPIRYYSSGFSRPAPIPLPPKEQREFENLVANPQGNLLREQLKDAAQSSTDATDELHPDYVNRRPKPTFQGEKNPTTGEIGGPKSEPLTHGDWSYGGRVTDF